MERRHAPGVLGKIVHSRAAKKNAQGITMQMLRWM
jgi:hypothetical protein